VALAAGALGRGITCHCAESRRPQRPVPVGFGDLEMQCSLLHTTPVARRRWSPRCILLRNMQLSSTEHRLEPRHLVTSCNLDRSISNGGRPLRCLAMMQPHFDIASLGPRNHPSSTVDCNDGLRPAHQILTRQKQIIEDHGVAKGGLAGASPNVRKCILRIFMIISVIEFGPIPCPLSKGSPNQCG
jgi:hypothetical protein